MINATAEQVIKEMRSHPFTLLAVLGLIFAAVWGYTTYAQAADVDSQIATLKAEVASNGKKIDRVLLLQYAEAIRGQRRQICGTNDEALRVTLQGILDNLQAEYMAINGAYYPVGECTNGP